MKLRSFIAVEIPGEIQRAIQRSTASLQNTLPKPMVRWVATQNLHLTLKFMGDVTPEGLDHLAEALAAGLVMQRSFDMPVAGLGMFPTSQRPKIIWVGLEAPAALAGLQQNVDAIASRIGFRAEDRPYSPHLTLGRVGQSASQTDLARIRTAIGAVSIGKLGTVHVEALTIFKSDLRPGGPIYSPLYTLPLKP